MTTKLFQLKAGQSVRLKRSATKLRHKPGKYDTVSMIAGGVGLTPILHLLRTSLDDPEEKTKLNLLYCNKSQKDIILREELEELQRQHPDRFKLHLMID
eukprot:gene1414-4349_t